MCLALCFGWCTFVEGGAYLKKYLFPERHSLDRVYEVDYDLTGPILMSEAARIGWVLNYITRGSNIVFNRRLRDISSWKVGILFDRNDECRDDVERQTDTVSRVTLGSNCASTRHIVQMVLKALGMIAEHQRADRDHKVYVGPRMNDVYPILADATLVTDYDIASVMHRTIPENEVDQSGYGMAVRDQADAKQAAGSRAFLSDCDWATLNTMYPGINPVPPCDPGRVPFVAVPSSSLLREKNFDVAKAKWTCHFDNAVWFDIGGCRLVEGLQFPLLLWRGEVRTMPSGTIQPDRILAFCEDYQSRDLQKLSHQDCLEACTGTCPKSYDFLTLPNCMQSKFSACFHSR